MTTRKFTFHAPANLRTMDFRLPFPTLMHLTMVCIGKVTLDKEIRPLKKLQAVDDDSNQIYTFEVEKIVTPLDLPAILKHELSDVITGMFRQVERSLLLDDCEEYECHGHLEQRKLLYDVHGKLDLATIWKRFFDNEVSVLNSLDPLLNLLYFVIAKELWYGLDAIVSKILSVACRDADASFKKRKLVLSTINQNFAFVYRFDNSWTSTRCLSQLKSLFQRHECVTVSKEALYVYLLHDSQKRLPFRFFRDYFRRVQRPMNMQEQVLFINGILFWYSSETFLDIFKSLDQETRGVFFYFVMEMQREKFSFGHDNPLYNMLDMFLQWPLTHLFMPFLEFALPTMTTHDVFTIISAIQKRIPERGRFGVLYGDLLSKYWQAIPPEIKEEFRTQGCSMDSCDHVDVLRRDMGELAKKKKYLSEWILTETGV